MSSNKYIRTLRAVGFTGALLTFLTIGVAGGFLNFITGKLLVALGPVLSASPVPRSALPMVKLAVAGLLWLPIIPVTLSAAFSPVRLAWIHGRVRIGDFFDAFGDGFSRSITALRLSIRQLILVALPFIGISGLLSEGDYIRANMQFIEFLAFLAVGLLGFSLWRAAAVICIVPITIVSQCTPLAAALECKYVIKSRHRLAVFLLLVAISGCIFGGMLAKRQILWENWQIDAALVALCALGWALVTAFGVVCIDASLEYIKVKADNPASAEATQYGAAPVAPAIQAYLPDGRPITVPIQSIQLRPER